MACRNRLNELKYKRIPTQNVWYVANVLYVLSSGKRFEFPALIMCKNAICHDFIYVFLDYKFIVFCFKLQGCLLSMGSGNGFAPNIQDPYSRSHYLDQWWSSSHPVSPQGGAWQHRLLNAESDILREKLSSHPEFAASPGHELRSRVLWGWVGVGGMS